MSGSVTINSNILSAITRRRLDEHTFSVSRASERLASGLRINRASDDAAGLAISSKLNADSRVLGQAVRNANDALSLLNIAEGATHQLRDILFRMKELGTGASNGAFSRAQRISIDTEALALTNEYNRIIQSTSFNGRNLLDGSLTDLGIQLGYGSNGSLNFEVGKGLSRTVGTGSFGTSVAIGAGDLFGAAQGDVNQDGIIDIVSASYGSPIVSVRIGKGDGTFNSAVDYDSGTAGAIDTVLSDIDGNGTLDIVNATTGSISVLLNQGKGTFGTATTFLHDAGGGGYDIKVADINGDGRNDILATDLSYGRILTYLNTGGSGTGRFTPSSFTIGISTSGIQDMTLGDFNSDGVLDIVTANGQGQGWGTSDQTLNLFLGNGNGTFKSRATLSSGKEFLSVTNADFNHDGNLDVVTVTSEERIHVLLGNGNGTFKAEVTYAAGNTAATGYEANQVIVGDVNGDGIYDLAVSDYAGNSVQVLLGNANGTFSAAISTTTGTGPYSIMLADLNGDGVAELISASYADNTLNINSPTTSQSTMLPVLDFRTQSDARSSLDAVESAFLRVSKELGTIGSSQSRLQTAIQTLLATRENYLAAEARITNVDIAQESANLVRSQILQQTASSILAQANQAPALALKLLNSV